MFDSFSSSFFSILSAVLSFLPGPGSMGGAGGPNKYTLRSLSWG